MKKVNKTNPHLLLLIDELKMMQRERGGDIWRDIAKRLEKPKRNWAEVNLSKLERYAEDGEVIIVPGKVLASGDLNKKVTIAAFSFSESAKAKIESAGGRNLSISQLMDENPEGSNIRIMG